MVELLIIGIFLVGLLVVGGVVLNLVFGAVDFGKRATAGLAVQNAPVRTIWRGLPLPVASDQLRPKSEREVVYVIPGPRVWVASQWFENHWVREGYILAWRQDTPTAREGPHRQYLFQRPGEEGGIVVLFLLVPPQFQGAEAVTSVAISDQR